MALGRVLSREVKLRAMLCCCMQARNTSMLAQCFYHLEDFASLTKLVEVLTEGQPVLADIGRKLQSVGLCTEAVAAFTKVCWGRQATCSPSLRPTAAGRPLTSCTSIDDNRLAP